MSESDTPAEAVALRVLDGGAAPPGIDQDLLRLLALPEPVQQEFWVVLGAYLQPILDEAAQRTVVEFCERHDVTSERLAPAVKGTRFLFQEAARHDASPADVAADLAVLLDADDAREVANLVLPWVEDFLPKLRANLARQAIADHGKVVTGAHWRVDRIGSSSRGKNLNASVAVVTFSYQDGDESRRITLHLLPDQVDALRRSANDMLA